EKDSSGNWVIKGGGLYKSTDSGKNWKLISLKETDVYKIFIDPKDSKIIYVNTSNGFKRSTDGGITWKNLFNENVDTMSFHPNLPIIYANRGRNLIKSEDDGLTWKYITWDYSIDPVKFSKITSLAIDDNDPNNVYIGTDGTGIYKFGVLEKEAKFIPPSPPTLSLNYQDNSIKLSWTKPEDGSYPIIGYSLYKKIDNNDWFLLRNFDKDTLEYTDTDIKPQTTYSYYIQSFDSQNNFSEKSNIVTFYIPLIDTTPPILEITSPPSDNYITNTQTFTLSGKTFDNESGIQKLLINNNEVNINPNGDFSYNINLIEGENNFLIISLDKENNKTRKTIKIICDLTPPQILVNIPNETSESSILISGSISDNISGIKYLKINNSNISISLDNKFSYTLNLSEGINNILIEAEDNAGNKISKENKIIKIIKRTTMIFQINNEIMYLDNNPINMEVSPQIIENRTYLPIRYILEPLGANLSWDSDEKKVTIIFNDTLIELWIGKNIAKVNGYYKLIDPENPKVVPMIIQGRTMLPVRFVAENLGCKVEWNPIYQSITITYPGV
ncbi:MAG: fibronectin type III domain-containing protein, partial [Caldisericia bacterium]|nr:fibronectin type III domain-containing protein [Caldisericia bacterium]